MDYNRLWKLLIDKNLLIRTSKDLGEMAELSTNEIAKMDKSRRCVYEGSQKNL